MKKYLTVLNSLLLLLLPVNIVNGCGFSVMADEYRVYLLQPDIAGSRELTQLFYAPDYFYFDPSNETDQPMIEANAREWQAHTHYRGTWKQVKALMYDRDAESFLRLRDSLELSDPFMKHLKKHYPQELDYFAYAKKCELMINGSDPWMLSVSEDTVFAAACLKEGEALYKKANNAFLKMRISYQLLKLSYYHPGFGEEPGVIYATRIKPLPLDSWLKESAHFYALAAESRSPDHYQYLLSRCFDESVDKRFRCVELFDRRHVKKFLPFTRNDHEKAVMWLMYELQNAGRSMPNLKKIYALDPSNKDLAFLMLREINKLEDLLLTPELTAQDPSIVQHRWSEEMWESAQKRMLSDKRYLDEVYAFAQKVIADRRQPEPALWQVLAAHLAILKNDKAQAILHLEEAGKVPAGDKVAFQVRLDRLLMNFDGRTALTPALKQQILDFADYHAKHPDVFLNQDIMINQVYLYIGKRLMHAGDVANGIFLLSRTNRVIGTVSYWDYKNYYEEMLEHALPKDYDEMLRVIGKKQKTPFEQFLVERRVTPFYEEMPDTMRIDRDKVLDYKSMYYVQHGQLDSALACVSLIAPAYWNKAPYDLFKCFPFKVPGSLELQSNHDFCPYNKRQFLQRMCDLNTLIAANAGDMARNYFVLATGYFNMGYHGNYWIMNMPYKLSDEVRNNYYELDTRNKPFIDNYYGCKMAQDNYLKAMSLAKDTAFAALCAARASACNIHLQEIAWRKTARFNEKTYSWARDFNPRYGVYKQLFEKRFGKKENFYEDFVSNCYHYEHLSARYF